MDQRLPFAAEGFAALRVIGDHQKIPWGRRGGVMVTRPAAFGTAFGGAVRFAERVSPGSPRFA